VQVTPRFKSNELGSFANVASAAALVRAGVNIPILMRSHMCAFQYSNRELAADTLAVFAAARVRMLAGVAKLAQSNAATLLTFR
jgi:hypothetical protein